jgi:hypothetical protein
MLAYAMGYNQALLGRNFCASNNRAYHQTPRSL